MRKIGFLLSFCGGAFPLVPFLYVGMMLTMFIR